MTMTHYTITHKTWALILANKTFDLDRVRNTLLDNNIDFTNLKADNYSFYLDTPTPDKIDFHLWYSKANSKKFGHKYYYFSSMSSKKIN